MPESALVVSALSCAVVSLIQVVSSELAGVVVGTGAVGKYGVVVVILGVVVVKRGVVVVNLVGVVTVSGSLSE